MTRILIRAGKNPVTVLSHEESAFGPRQDVIGRRQVMSRLRWLRQGHEGDPQRPAYAFEPPFPRGLEERVSQLQKELALKQNFLANCRGRVRRLLRISPSSTGVGR
ncbi:hypothetical protein EV384_4491 [Micromonospora kangleipakensis]|uniref:Uncharacterized protein n=1 Tax=Micromonospora kangleipakensis TaxID=1077942 RepID=A0A4V2GDH2_9ACTN|nr:hypothetical protein EV384_4491 [Micromonospora kangleipakensis]